MIFITPFILIFGVVIVGYIGANAFLSLAIALVGISIAGIIGLIAYKMFSNIKSNCDLFSARKCKR